MPSRNLQNNQKVISKKLLLMERTLSQDLARAYGLAGDAIRRDLLKVFERYAVNGELTHAEMSKFNRLRALERQLVKDVQPALLESRRITRLAANIQYEEAFYRYAWSIDQAIGVELQWGLLNTKTVTAAVQNKFVSKALGDLGKNLTRRMRDAVTQGLIRGQSMDRMARNVMDAVGATKSDAMRIVRTEAHRARELGNLAVSDGAVDQGVELLREWNAALDNRVRNSHANLDGKQRAPGETFPGGAEYPGGFGVASEDINCRCTLIDIIKGLEPELRRTREDGVQPYQSFETWAKGHGVDGSKYGEKYNFVR